eukprot:6225669-Pyramimonas_sp.AAC.1
MVQRALCILIARDGVGGGNARNTQYAAPPAVPVKNQCDMIVTRPRMIQMLVQRTVGIVLQRMTCGGDGLARSRQCSGNPAPSMSRTHAK